MEQCDGSHILDQLSTLEDRAIVLEIALNSDHVDWSDRENTECTGSAGNGCREQYSRDHFRKRSNAPPDLLWTFWFPMRSPGERRWQAAGPGCTGRPFCV